MFYGENRGRVHTVRAENGYNLVFCSFRLFGSTSLQNKILKLQHTHGMSLLLWINFFAKQQNLYVSISKIDSNSAAFSCGVIKIPQNLKHSTSNVQIKQIWFVYSRVYIQELRGERMLHLYFKWDSKTLCTLWVSLGSQDQSYNLSNHAWMDTGMFYQGLRRGT